MKTGIEFFHTRNLRVTQSKQSVYPKAEYRDLSEEFLLKWDSCTEHHRGDDVPKKKKLKPCRSLE